MEKAKQYLDNIVVPHGQDYGFDDVQKALEIAYLEGMLSVSSEEPHTTISYGLMTEKEIEQRLKELLDE